MCMEAEMTTGQSLMAELRHMGVEVKIAADKLDELEAENAKLRELVRLLHEHINDNLCQPDEECGEYGCYQYDKEHDCCKFDHAMRELGIEVGE